MIISAVEMYLVCVVLFCFSSLAGSSATSNSAPIHNANHIFNAIHSSMRQWGSSWNYNGMSFFLATVPQHTLLYHGSLSAEPVTGVEWLAFEPEHALWFTNNYERSRVESLRGTAEKRLDDTNQIPLTTETRQRGWLHTYAASHDLRLLYVDGISAGKTTMGTLDTQDRILLNDRPEDFHNDATRAKMVCELFNEEWGGRIDGLLRMETGFEIILCDFGRNLRRVTVGRGKPYTDGISVPIIMDEMWRLYKVIASRYGGIGGGRVHLNYDHFVTAFNYPALDLFKNGSELPRLANISLELLEPLKRDLYNLVMENDTVQSHYNWQDITDMIVTRYANDLKYFVSGKLDNLKALHLEIERVLLPFIDFDNRNSSAELRRCAQQYLMYNQPSTTLSSRAIESVSTTICTVLLSSLDLKEYDDVIASIQGLVDYLSWTVWKECPQKCGYNEVCFIPIWPAGTVEDRENPQCKDRLSLGGKPYWNNTPSSNKIW